MGLGGRHFAGGVSGYECQDVASKVVRIVSMYADVLDREVWRKS